MVSLTLSIAMYAGLALSWSMFSGATGYVALSTSAFFGLGAYTCAILLGSWSVAIRRSRAGARSAALLALMLGLCVLHLRGTYFAILTFGISELLKNLIMYIEKSEFGTVGRLMMGAPPLSVIYWTVLALAVLAAVIYWLVARSDFGAALRAIGSDEARASTLGLNVRNAKIAGFCLSALIPGAIGAAMSVRWTYIEPQIVFNPFIVFQTVLVATIGGPTRLIGPILGAVVFGLLARNAAAELRQLLPDTPRRAADPLRALRAERPCQPLQLQLGTPAPDAPAASMPDDARRTARPDDPLWRHFGAVAREHFKSGHLSSSASSVRTAPARPRFLTS